ncbi:unnamed protein product [Cuscuta campestris]|uniref:Uncharacterized protein n=1 Tax=Cuscuta campestris TaxID=132261 RepID=A0A484LU99_9ASTE|nr:unnamed protein product [Cuscuta campestris]
MVCSAKKERSTNEVSSYDEDEELRTEDQMDRSRRDGQPEESGRADRLQTINLMDRLDVRGRPSERQNDRFLRDDQTVDLVDRPDIHGRPSARQNDVSLRDDQTVDRDVEDGRPSPRQKVSDPEQLQTADPVDRSTDSGRPSSSLQAVENLERGQREKRPNICFGYHISTEITRTNVLATLSLSSGSSLGRYDLFGIEDLLFHVDHNLLHAWEALGRDVNALH